MTPPVLTGNPAEGGAEAFQIDYFGRPGYLSQSAQLYLEALLFPNERVYALTPSFRAEKSRTPRHLTEYLHLEVELAWCDLGRADGLHRADDRRDLPPRRRAARRRSWRRSGAPPRSSRRSRPRSLGSTYREAIETPPGEGVPGRVRQRPRDGRGAGAHDRGARARCSSPTSRAGSRRSTCCARPTTRRPSRRPTSSPPKGTARWSGRARARRRRAAHRAAHGDRRERSGVRVVPRPPAARQRPARRLRPRRRAGPPLDAPPRAHPRDDAVPPDAVPAHAVSPPGGARFI